jgi:Flp pilus assembly protein TadD
MHRSLLLASGAPAVAAILALLVSPMPARSAATGAQSVDCARCHEQCKSGSYPDNARPEPPSSSTLRHVSAAAERAFADARRLDPAFGGNDGRGAVEAYRRALVLDPGNIAYRNHLAAALLTVGEHGEAIRTLDEIVRVVPRESKYLVNLGYAWHRSGDEQRALVWYMRALVVDEGDVRARLFAGYALEILGLPAEAIVEFRRVLAAHPDHDGARRALQRLGVLAPPSSPGPTAPPAPLGDPSDVR